MHRTDRLISLNHPSDGRFGWSAALAGSLAVFVIALAVMLVMRAGWLDHALALSPTASAQWLPAALAAGVLLGGISLLWLVLARFAREVESAPYVWLAPVMTALPSIAIVAWNLTPPAGLPGRLFAVAWVPLLIGGGSLFRLFGLARKLLGALLWGLPAIWVLTDATIRGQGNLLGGFRGMPHDAQMFTAVVTLTCTGVGFLAFLTRDRGLDMRSLREERRQLAQERMSIAEERATLAGEREGLDVLVARAEAALGGPAPGLDADELALLDKQRPLWPLAIIPFALAAAVLAYEFGHRRPMLETTLAMRALQTKHDERIASLRRELGSHHTEALAALERERDRAIEQRDSLAAELEELRREGPGVEDGTPSPAPGKASPRAAQPDHPEEAKAPSSAQREEARAARKGAEKTQAAAAKRARIEKQRRAARRARAARRERAEQRKAAAKRADAASKPPKTEAPSGAAKATKSLGAESDDPLLGLDF